MTDKQRTCIHRWKIRKNVDGCHRKCGKCKLRIVEVPVGLFGAPIVPIKSKNKKK